MKAATIMTLVGLMFPYPAIAHDIYTDWQRPDVGGSCCNGIDCAPTQAYWNGKRWMAMYQGKYIEVPPEKVLKRKNPDGNAHLCAAQLIAPTGVTVYCFMPPEAKF